MFQLEDDEQRRFMDDQKNGLDEEQLQSVEVYEQSVRQSRQVELQVLEWENTRYNEALAAGRGLQQWSTSVVADDLKSKFEQTKQYLADLTTHQAALNEQIEALMSLKQPVQHETTYVLKSVQDPVQSYNVTVLSGPSQPKLTYDQFCQRLYSSEPESQRVEHLVKREVAQMAEGLLSLHKSLLGAAKTVAEAEAAARCQEKSAHIRRLIQRIHKMDRLALMTVVEHGVLKKNLLALEKERAAETAAVREQADLLASQKEQLQRAAEIELRRLREEHERALGQHTDHLTAQRTQLRARLQALLMRDDAPSHEFFHESVSENDESSSNNGVHRRPGSDSSRNLSRSNKHGQGKGKHNPRSKFSDMDTTSLVQGVKKSLETTSATDPLVILQNEVQRAKSRYLSLERRNRLEMEGYASEVLSLRQRLRQFERSHVRMAQLGDLST